MKTRLSVIILILLATDSFAQADLEITVKNIRQLRGSLRIGLFNNEKDFPNKAVLGQVIPVTADSLTVTFTDLKPGSYAISVVHDGNNNGKLDTNVFGIPNEGFAFGNNAMGRFGPPSFTRSQVMTGEFLVKQVLALKYF